jgi:hypothetical protein
MSLLSLKQGNVIILILRTFMSAAAFLGPVVFFASGGFTGFPWSQIVGLYRLQVHTGWSIGLSAIDRGMWIFCFPSSYDL